MAHPSERMRRAARVGCPFCWEWIPTPTQEKDVFSPEGCLGGRCTCGAVFVIDETGRLGGQACSMRRRCCARVTSIARWR